MDPPAPPTAEQEAEGKIKELQELVEKQQEEILALKEKYEPSTDKFRKAAGTYDTSDEVPVWVQVRGEEVVSSSTTRAGQVLKVSLLTVPPLFRRWKKILKGQWLRQPSTPTTTGARTASKV